LAGGGLKMDHKKMFDALIEKVGEEELSRIMGRRIGGILVGQMCPSLFELPITENCGDYRNNVCPDCWAKALELEEEIS